MLKNNLPCTRTSSAIDRQKGFAMPVVIVIIALVVIIGGIFYFLTTQRLSSKESVMEKEGTMMEKKEGESMMEKKEGDSMMERKGDTMMENEPMMKYSGAVIAGKSAPLIDFNKADYDEALKTDKLIVLYFYANWCPICKVEVSSALYPTFNELTSDKVIGFRVNYNDNQTDNDEVNLAREFGVAYQHTKVFLKNGQRVLKSPESWNKNRYLEEINKY